MTPLLGLSYEIIQAVKLLRIQCASIVPAFHKNAGRPIRVEKMKSDTYEEWLGEMPLRALILVVAWATALSELMSCRFSPASVLSADQDVKAGAGAALLI